MGQVINVNFKKGVKIESYLVWRCIVCIKSYEIKTTDSEKVARIVVRPARGKTEEECICQSCAIDVANLAKEQGWIDG